MLTIFHTFGIAAVFTIFSQYFDNILTICFGGPVNMLVPVSLFLHVSAKSIGALLFLHASANRASLDVVGLMWLMGHAGDEG